MNRILVRAAFCLVSLTVGLRADPFSIPGTSLQIDISFTSSDPAYRLTPAEINQLLQTLSRLPVTHLRYFSHVTVSPYASTGVCSVSFESNSFGPGAQLLVKDPATRQAKGFCTSELLTFAMPQILYLYALTPQQRTELKGLPITDPTGGISTFLSYYGSWLFDSFGSVLLLPVYDPSIGPRANLNYYLFMAGFFTDWQKKQIYTYNGATSAPNLVPVVASQSQFAFTPYQFNFSSGKVTSYILTNPPAILVAAPFAIPSSIAAHLTGPLSLDPSFDSGDGQTGLSGATLTDALSVTVSGVSGVPLEGVPVAFSLVSGSATIATPSSTTNFRGMASTRLTLGNSGGRVVVQATSPGLKPVTFNLMAIDSTWRVRIVSGDGQSGLPGASLAKPLVVGISSTAGAPVPGVRVNFAVIAGKATLNPASVISGADGTAAINVSLGAQTGSVQVSAGADFLNPVTFSLTSTNTPLPPGVSYTIDTFAGSNPLGDGGPAISAFFLQPSAMFQDPDGSLFIADTGNLRIRKVTSDGQVQTAFSSGLSYPRAATRDAAGNLYIADFNVVRKVDAKGISTIFAGTPGQSGFAGDGGPATKALLRSARALLFDNQGNLLIADDFEFRIRKVDAFGVITTFAGTGKGFSGDGGDGGDARQASMNQPISLALDQSGNVLVAEGQRIRIISPDNLIRTFAGGGMKNAADSEGAPAVQARLGFPSGLAVDGSGQVYIADSAGHLVRMVSPDGNIHTIAGTGIAGSNGDGGAASAAQFLSPSGVAIDGGGNVLVLDGDRVRRITSDGAINAFAGQSRLAGDGGPASAGIFSNPAGIAVDSSGNIYIADSGNNAVRMVDPYGSLSTIAGNGVSGRTGDGGPASAATLNGPSAVAVDPAGNLYIADTFNSVIRIVTPDGTINTFAGNGRFGFGGDGQAATSGDAAFAYPAGLALGSDGTLYIADSQNHRIRTVTPDGMLNTFAGTGAVGVQGDSGPALNARLFLPSGVAVDASGALLIADTANGRIRKVDLAGNISSIQASSGDGALFNPVAVASDALGNIYAGDFYRIKRFTPAGVVSTVGGSANAGFSGDGGPATGGQLYMVTGLAQGPGGVWYAVDQRNQRVRILKPVP